MWKRKLPCCRERCRELLPDNRKEIFPETTIPAKQLEEIIKEIACKHSMLSVEELQKNNKSKRREYAMPRQVIMYLLHKACKYTVTRIGEKFSKNHATVLHAIRTVENLRKTDKIFRLYYGKITYELEMKMRCSWEQYNN